MSTEIFNQFAGGMRTLNTELTKAFAPDGTVCFLLRRAGETSQFEVVAELTEGFFVEFSVYRDGFVFTYATPDTDGFRDQFAQASYIAYGVPDQTSGTVEVYKFVPYAAGVDVIDPNGSSPFWKAVVEKDRRERFAVPV